ncbi:MAG: peptide chain release factor N(5)-glutamine methyltransferase [Pseudomonadota bacterium]
MTSVGQWLQATDDLPRLDLELLLNHLLGVTRAQLLTHPERQLSSTEQEQLNQLLAVRRAGEPIAYILGTQEFWGLPFKVSPAVLIPRPETELLVELAIATAPPRARVLELGTGSGAIAVALTHSRPDLHLTAVDCSDAALQVAQTNAVANGVQIELRQSNWFTAVEGKWDLIISNPPYIADNDPHLPSLRYEPDLALLAGPQGMCALSHIIQNAPAYLADHGGLLLEHGYDQAAVVAAQLNTSGWQDIHSHQDLAGIERVTAASRPPSANRAEAQGQKKSTENKERKESKRQADG